MSDQILHLSDGDFEKTISQSDKLVLVDFWAPWCGPCRMLGPIIEDLAEDYAGKVVVAKVNTDENPSIPGRFDIMSIPTLLLFRDGELVDRAVGMRPKPALKAWIDSAI